MHPYSLQEAVRRQAAAAALARPGESRVNGIELASVAVDFGLTFNTKVTSEFQPVWGDPR